MDHKTPLLLALTVLLAFAACAPAHQFTLVSSRQLRAASGVPEIDAVLGLGNRRIVGNDIVSLKNTDSDLQIGELVYIRGRRFGKQPTVTIDSRPAAVLGLAREGGIVTRIPTGIDVGKVVVEVSNNRGTGRYQASIARLAAIISGEELRLVKVLGEHAAPRWLRTIPTPGATHLVIESLGAVAYLAGNENGKAKLWARDLGTIPPGKNVRQRELPGQRIVAFAASLQAARSVVITDTHLVVIDSTEPAWPAFHKPWPLVELGLQGQIRDCAISADGQRLALLLNEKNRLLLFGLTKLAALGNAPFHKAKPRPAPQPMVFDALPEARLPVARAIAFARTANQLWLVSGDTRRSIAGGYQPQRLTLFDVVAEPRLLRQVDLPKMFAPRYLAIGAGEPRPAGTSIRQAPATDAIYVAAQQSDTLKAGGKLPSGQVQRGTTFRVHGKDELKTFSGAFNVGPVILSGKRPVLLGLVATQKKGSWQKQLYSISPWQRQPTAQKLDFKGAKGISKTAPLEWGGLAIQP